jgi:hypothetical protein
VFECDREASIMGRLWPSRNCCAMGEKKIVVEFSKGKYDIFQSKAVVSTDNPSVVPPFCRHVTVVSFLHVTELGRCYEIVSCSQNTQTVHLNTS